MKKVKFTEMKKGSKEDYLLLDKLEKKYIAGTADRIIKFLRSYEETLEGYQVSRLEHSLQAATRALKDGASEEMIVATLLHDIGDDLAPLNHSEYAAAVLRPYVSEKTYWIMQKHGEFQMFYYAHHLGGNRNARNKYKGHKYYDDCVDFCERWDQTSFDPKYKSLKLEDFEPLIKKIFNRKPYSN
ncbi:HD domain-containing protein [Candidatus Pelagibacter sp.]|nr:HD domain-containing protein [Candidatus Pelagibacter sp.]